MYSCRKLKPNKNFFKNVGWGGELREGQVEYAASKKRCRDLGGGGEAAGALGGFVGQMEAWRGNDYGYCANTSVTLYEPMSRTGKKPRPTPRIDISASPAWCAMLFFQNFEVKTVSTTVTSDTPRDGGPR